MTLHSWAFYELASFIAYKAREIGIKVVYIKPEYTSQTCPSFGDLNKVKDRNYYYGCGYHDHHYRIGARGSLRLATAGVMGPLNLRPEENRNGLRSARYSRIPLL
ncbi:IS605 OrfB family transposase [Trichococcus patagoniensis]|uniref:IS605 OrfB family transposase n=1 Tax=Trichococcus patagoniensis TaxID=382641 RepID=A0A2T5I718_9LACT|nr:zinc ribbon domain-containing protein [Trichococcus patagoniensis]PTQ79631.1 IS605 OrfB family transposase [Trichococcus patagoniensis]